MLRIVRIGTRRYDVRRDGAHLGIVSEPVLGRGWVFQLDADSERAWWRREIGGWFQERLALFNESPAARSYASRRLAIVRLLEAYGLNAATELSSTTYAEAAPTRQEENPYRTSRRDATGASIEVVRVETRRYRVLRNGVRLGIVSAPTPTRGWVYQFEPGNTRVDRMWARASNGQWASHSPPYLNRSYASRRMAVARLLLECGFDPSEVNRAPGRATRDPGEPAFGVEIEMTGPTPGEIIRALRAAGTDVVNDGGYHATTGDRWELKHDSSVNGHGMELASPKLVGTAGFAELQTVCRALAAAGATVDRSCGLHVHHDLRGLDLTKIKTRVLAFLNHQDLVTQMVARSRRTNDYCSRWAPESIQQLRDFTGAIGQVGYIGPRGSINLQSYPRHGSVEIRLHGGTVAFAKIAAWVRFGQALFAAAEAGGLARPRTDLRRLLSALQPHGLTSADVHVLLRFVTATEEADEQAEEADYVTEAAEVQAELNAPEVEVAVPVPVPAAVQRIHGSECGPCDRIEAARHAGQAVAV